VELRFFDGGLGDPFVEVYINDVLHDKVWAYLKNGEIRFRRQK